MHKTLLKFIDDNPQLSSYERIKIIQTVAQKLSNGRLLHLNEQTFSSDFTLNPTTSINWKWAAPEGKQSVPGLVFAFAFFSHHICTGREWSKSDETIVQEWIRNGRRPLKPVLIDESVQDSLYTLLCDCWQQDSEKRPSWTEILERLHILLETVPRVITSRRFSQTIQPRRQSKSIRDSLVGNFALLNHSFRSSSILSSSMSDSGLSEITSRSISSDNNLSTNLLKPTLETVFKSKAEIKWTEFLSSLSEAYPSVLYNHSDLLKKFNPAFKDSISFQEAAMVIGNKRLDIFLLPYLAESLNACIRAIALRGGNPHKRDMQDITMILIRNKWCLEEKDAQSYTPLHYAAQTGNVEACIELLDCGANVQAKTNVFEKQMSPLHLAIQNDHLEICKLLYVKRESCLTLRNADGDQAIHTAARFGRLEIVKWLVEIAGVDLEVRNENFLGKKMGTFVVLVSMFGFPPLFIIIKAIGGNLFRGDTASFLAKRKTHKDLYPYVKEKRTEAKALKKNKQG